MLFSSKAPSSRLYKRSLHRWSVSSPFFPLVLCCHAFHAKLGSSSFRTCSSHAHFRNSSLQLSLAAEPPLGLRRGLRGAQEAKTERLSANIDSSSGEEDVFFFFWLFPLRWTADSFSCRKRHFCSCTYSSRNEKIQNAGNLNASAGR